MNARYRKGYRFEMAIYHKFKNAGYFVIRSAGSHGEFDIIAIKDGRILGIQCKYDGRLTKAELERIKETAIKYGILPYLAFAKNRRYYIKNLLADLTYPLNLFLER